MIHVITGPPCGGKTTYMYKNGMWGDVKIDFDEIAETFGAEPYKAEGFVREVALAARATAIEKALANPDRESWIIHTQPSDAQMARYREAGAEIVVCDPGKEECLRRAERQHRPQETIDGIEYYYSEKKGEEMHLYKSFDLKADDAGTISGYFSTYDRIPDSYGDVIAPGAFLDTIKARKESGHPFPLCWNHDLDQIIGAVDPDDITETEKGPLMVAKFFDTPIAQEKREIVKSGVVYQFSFAYDVKDAAAVTLEDGTKANELRKLDLFEISIVPIPANQNAVMTEVKSGRRNSLKDETTIKEVITLLQGLLGELEEAVEPEGEDEPEVNAAAEEPKASNPEKDRLLEYIKNLTTEE